MRHIGRVHKIDLDWLYERFRSDPGLRILYINTKLQIADILTKGAFTGQQWKQLCDLANVIQQPLTPVAGGDPAQGHPHGKSGRPSVPQRAEAEKANKTKEPIEQNKETH